MRFILIIILLITSNAYAIDIRKIYSDSSNTVSKANYILNDTNLSDQEIGKDLFKKVSNITKQVEKKTQEIIKKNKNRKKPRYKGPIEEIFKDYANNVVLIATKKRNSIEGYGSGFFINFDGDKIITNWHVVDDSNEIVVWTRPSKRTNIDFLIDELPFYRAEIVKLNKKKDLAMLEIKGVKFEYNKINFANYDEVIEGEPVFAIGHPKELIWSFTDGRISSVRPNWKWEYRGSSHNANVIQTTTSINPGNSGGPLFNKQKMLVGVNTYTHGGELLNFAIGVNDLNDFLYEKKKPIKKKESPYIKKKKKGNTWIKKKKKKTNKEISGEFIEKDLNKNGTIDSWGMDKNKNGVFEIVYADPNEDGNIEVTAIDQNEDGNFEIILFDTNGNGNPDEAEVDKNEDGIAEYIAYDLDEDGTWDKFEKI